MATLAPEAIPSPPCRRRSLNKPMDVQDIRPSDGGQRRGGNQPCGPVPWGDSLSHQAANSVRPFWTGPDG
jgi:hypothetical protein